MRRSETESTSTTIARIRAARGGAASAIPRTRSMLRSGGVRSTTRIGMFRGPRLAKPRDAATKRSRFIQPSFTGPRAKSLHQTRSDGNAQDSSRRGAFGERSDGSKCKRDAHGTTFGAGHHRHPDGRLRLRAWISPVATRLLPAERRAALRTRVGPSRRLGGSPRVAGTSGKARMARTKSLGA